MGKMVAELPLDIFSGLFSVIAYYMIGLNVRCFVSVYLSVLFVFSSACVPIFFRILCCSVCSFSVFLAAGVGVLFLFLLLLLLINTKLRLYQSLTHTSVCVCVCVSISKNSRGLSTLSSSLA